MCTNVKDQGSCKDRFVFESFPFIFDNDEECSSSSFSEISAVNVIVGWKLSACSMNRLIACLLESHRENVGP